MEMIFKKYFWVFKHVYERDIFQWLSAGMNSMCNHGNWT